MKKNTVLCVLLAVLMLAVSAMTCFAADDDIIVLYTNDVHCGIEENIGYAGLAAYKAYVQSLTPYVTLIDNGDALQGDTIGTVSKGEYLVDIMNKVGYDLAVLGNHEFDYGMERLNELLGKANAQYIGANLTYVGEGDSLLASVEPYVIKEYGETKVAYIGVTTPKAITSSTPAYFQDEEGNFIYGFIGGADGTDLYNQIQAFADEAREAGADYVILCAHLGDTEDVEPYTSVSVIKNTNGIDAVLDGHSHSEISSRLVMNKDGEPVMLSSTGTKLNNIGVMIITANGKILTGLVDYYDEKDAEVEQFIADIKGEYEDALNVVVAQSNVALSVLNEGGIRQVRNRETAIGNLCADAYRSLTDAQVAFVNGGGIRADIPEGDVTYANVIAVHPYGNMLTMVNATGQQILDALEWSVRNTMAEATDGQNALGENGGFLQPSGLEFTINTAVESTCQYDEETNTMFAGVAGDRRVEDVCIYDEEGVCQPIDPEANYTVASHNYMLKNGGDGFNMFAEDEILIDESMLDYEVLVNYINSLDGDLSAYANGPQGRITIK